LSYFESRLKVNFERSEDIFKKLKLCEILGIKNIILEPNKDMNEISNLIKNNIEKNFRLNIYYRFNLSPKNLTEFKKKIKNYNNYEEIISVESDDREIQIYAARDSRVDILSFSDINILKTLTPGVISLVKQNNSFIEFSLAPIMEKNKQIQSKNFRNLYRFIKLVLKLKVNYIISGNFENKFDFRNPRALISVCHTLLGMSLKEAKKGFRDYPRLLLNRVKNRLDKTYLEKGVRIIKG